MIYTYTLNPAIDYHMAFENLTLGALNRAHFNRFTIGGKGINVAVMLKRLEADVVATGFLGGFTGAYCEDYLREHHHLKTHFISILDNTRINVKLDHQNATELNARAPYVKQAEYDKLTAFNERLEADDWVVLAGSGIPSQPQAYDDIARICQAKGISFIADFEGEALLKILPYHPFLVKPNLFELETLFHETLKSDDEIIKAAIKLQDLGAHHVLVSLGANGSLFVSQTEVLRAHPIDVAVRNTVGAGDSMVGAFLATYLKTQNIVESYRMAVAAGTATAMAYGLATLEDIEALLPKTHIETVKR